MGDNSAIEWTDATWNPTRGCSRVSPGCTNCYAERQARRHAHKNGAYEGLLHSTGAWNGGITLVEGALDLPERWRKPRRIFVDSMSDLFHERVPFEFIDKVFEVMITTPQHTYQVLTKLQLDVIERALVLWSNPGDTVLSPFMGIGSEGYQAIKTARRFLGIELKHEYWRQSVENLKGAAGQSDMFAAREKST